jgi:hypothetical protein
MLHFKGKYIYYAEGGDEDVLKKAHIFQPRSQGFSDFPMTNREKPWERGCIFLQGPCWGYW